MTQPFLFFEEKIHLDPAEGWGEISVKRLPVGRWGMGLCFAFFGKSLFLEDRFLIPAVKRVAGSAIPSHPNPPIQPCRTFLQP